MNQNIPSILGAMERFVLFGLDPGYYTGYIIQRAFNFVKSAHGEFTDQDIEILRNLMNEWIPENFFFPWDQRKIEWMHHSGLEGGSIEDKMIFILYNPSWKNKLAITGISL